ncbi:MAG: hypothetical protein ACK6AT_15980, partial [Planctomycetota bacterium]
LVFKLHAQGTKWSFSMTRFVFLAFVFLSSAELFFSQNLIASVISPVSAQAWPNQRVSGDVPSQAIDGSINTFTWSTESFTTTSASLGLELSGLTDIDRIRLWKGNAAGESGLRSRKDLLIQYTTDTNANLSDRNWTNVSGLTNGFQGTEYLVATSVNSNGTVIGDFHDSFYSGDGWASLTFNPVQATGIRIFFSKTAGELNTYMHYLVYEFEVYGPELPSVPEPTSIAIFSALGSLGVVRGFKRYRKR